MKINIWKIVAIVALIIIVAGVVVVVKQNEAEKKRIEIEKQKREVEEHKRDVENQILNSLSNYNRKVENGMVYVQIINGKVPVDGGNVKVYSFGIPNNISVGGHSFGAFKASTL